MGPGGSRDSKASGHSKSPGWDLGRSSSGEQRNQTLDLLGPEKQQFHNEMETENDRLRLALSKKQGSE